VRAAVEGDDAGEPGASLYRVLDGGVVADAESVAVIERGGVVERSARPAMHFVRKGGALLRFDNPNGVVFREPGAILGPELANRREPLTVLSIVSVSVSPGVGPFLYTKPPRPAPGDAPKAPPVVRSITPPAATRGATVTVQGKGFARTTAVYLSDRVRTFHKAGFRVLSDTKLRVEVPDLDAETGPHLLVVVTSEGVTVTLPRNDGLRMDLALNPFAPRPRPSELPFAWAGRGETVRSDGPAVFFIAPGGQVAGTGAGGVYFVKNGGELADPGGEPAALFYEPKASVPARLKDAGKTAHEVPAITASVLDAALEVLPGPASGR
jgi:hypothetical protein